MRTRSITLACLIAATAAHADIVRYSVEGTAASGGTVRTQLSEDVRPVAAATIYDNYTSPAEGGRTGRGGVYASEDHVIQDDIRGVEWPSLLNSYYLLFSNRSSTSRLSEFTYSMEFVDQEGQAFGYHFITVDLSLFPLPENSTGVLGWGDGAFTGLNVTLPEQFSIRQRLYEPVGIRAADLGVPYGGPRTLGESNAGFLDATTGVFVGLPEPHSLVFKLRADPVPGPAALSLAVVTSSGFAARRRRDRGTREFGQTQNHKEPERIRRSGP